MISVGSYCEALYSSLRPAGPLAACSTTRKGSCSLVLLESSSDTGQQMPPYHHNSFLLHNDQGQDNGSRATERRHGQLKKGFRRSR